MIKRAFIIIIFTQQAEFSVINNFIHIDFKIANKNVFSSEMEKQIDSAAFDFSVYNIYYDGEKDIICVNYNSGNRIKRKNFPI